VHSPLTSARQIDTDTNDVNMLATPFAEQFDDLAQEFIVGRVRSNLIIIDFRY